jgi:hypothetical protein
MVLERMRRREKGFGSSLHMGSRNDEKEEEKEEGEKEEEE